MSIHTRSKAGSDDPPIAQSKVIVEFRGDPDRIQELLLPPPLEPVGDGDRGWVAVVDTVLPSIRQTEDVALEATAFVEAAIGTPCQYEGERYTVYPLLFLDRPSDGFERGITRGIADVAKTKHHSACPTRQSISAGDSIAGTASHRGEKLFDVAIDVEAERSTDVLPEGFFDFVHYRHLPDPLASGETGGLANDLAVMDFPSFEVGSVWEGDPTLAFGDWKDGLLSGLAEAVTTGYQITMGYEYGGDRVIAEVDADWGDHVE